MIEASFDARLTTPRTNRYSIKPSPPPPAAAAAAAPAASATADMDAADTTTEAHNMTTQLAVERYAAARLVLATRPACVLLSRAA